MTEQEVLARLKGAVARAGTQLAWANKNGISPGYLSDVLKRRRDPGERILAALGLERFTIYRKAESSTERAA